MKIKILIVTICSLLSYGSLYADQTSSLDNNLFNQFPATATEISKTPVKLQFTKSDDYKTQLRDLAKGKANFAGHYVVGIVGTNKELYSAPAMVDLNTGKIYYAPWTISAPLTQVNSRLLITDPPPANNDAKEAILGPIAFAGMCNAVIQNNNVTYVPGDDINTANKENSNSIVNDNGRDCKQIPAWVKTKYYVWDEQKHQFFEYVSGKVVPYVSKNTDEQVITNADGYFTTKPSQ